MHEKDTGRTLGRGPWGEPTGWSQSIGKQRWGTGKAPQGIPGWPEQPVAALWVFLVAHLLASGLSHHLQLLEGKEVTI